MAGWAMSSLSTLFLWCLLQQYTVVEIQCRSIASLNFFGLGDWGGLPISPYTTNVQRAVAKRMATYADLMKPEFIMAVGDNFYFTGVDDVNDPRFHETFEDVFNSASLNVPWYFCAGNHDHYGNVSGQIAYTEKSQRWNFPDFHYTKTWAIPGSSSTVQLIMIDTVILCGNVEHDNSKSPPSGPEHPKLAAQHWAWLQETLSESNADYLLVAGHFPVWSISSHGPTDCLVDGLRPLLEKYDATSYICGHDHNLQHLDDGSGVQYIVTGCANFVNPATDHAKDVPTNSSKFFWAEKSNLGGFTTFSATPTEMDVTYVDSTSLTPLYSIALKPRNKSKIKV